RAHLGVRHGQQPGLHQRDDPDGAAVDPAPRRRGRHPGVRRPVAARLARPAVQHHGLRRRASGVRPEPRGAPARQPPAVPPDAPLTADLPFPVPTEQLGEYTPGYTANGPVNAIPYVVAAPPGILRGVDLPPLVPGGPLS